MEPRNCSSRRRSKSSLRAPLSASPVGSPPQVLEFYRRTAANALKRASRIALRALCRSSAKAGSPDRSIRTATKLAKRPMTYSTSTLLRPATGMPTIMSASPLF